MKGVWCRERKGGGKRKWVSWEDVYGDEYETMGGMEASIAIYGHANVME